MAIKAHLEQTAAGDGQRAAARRALRLEASGLSPDGEEANVTIHNVSAGGLLIETGLALTTGEQLALDLPEAGIVSAAVVWNSERLYGCAFDQPLGASALAAVQLQGLAPGMPVPPRPAASPSLHSSEGLPARLNRLRREAGLTLADVAATLGVSKPTVWAWEKGKARPLPERLGAIADALGVPPDLLAPGSGAPRELDSVIADCRQRIAEASGVDPQAVRIMIEL